MSEFLPLGVIALPAIAPLIALIQLLFPGLLGEHWKQYRAAIGVLLSHSTLMFTQWIVTFWIAAESSWWLSPEALAWGLAGISTVGFFASLFLREPGSGIAPARIEYLALSGLAAASAAWLLWLWGSGAALLDQMLVVLLACGMALVHLQFRQAWATQNRKAGFATESIFLLVMAGAGIAMAQYAFTTPTAHGILSNLSGESLTFRSNVERSGVTQSETAPNEPKLLGQPFDLLPRAGLFFESSPVVVDGALFIGARHQVSASAGGLLFGVPLAANGEFEIAAETNAEENYWQFGDSTTRAIFSTPALHEQLLYFGEGYHQHQNGRIFCVEGRSGALLWSLRTSSHVESPPTIAQGNLYFGAGDDGLYCLELPARGASPRIAWHYKTLHVDSSPLVVEGQVFIGGVTGDRLNNLKAVALDALTGEKRWERPAEIPFPASASYDQGRLFFGLGNGKFSGEDRNPRGMVWCLNATDGSLVWEFPLASSVLTSVIPQGDSVYFVARNGECYSLAAATGELQWKQPLLQDVLAAPIVTSDRMIAVTASGSIHCLNLQTGKPIWQFEGLPLAGSPVISSPALHRGKLYVARGDKVFCVGDQP